MKRPMLEVLVRCNESSLHTVLDVLKGTAELLYVRPAKQQDAPSTATRFYRDGKRSKGIKGEDLAMEVLLAARGALVHMDTLKEAFEARGFASTSASPVLTSLVASQKVDRPQPGFFRIAVQKVDSPKPLI